MKITRLSIPELCILEPEVYKDSRGLFYESFSLKKFQTTTGLSVDFIQDNQSLSAKFVIRGLHYQRAPEAQGKIVRVVKGSIFDVAVDIRAESATLGQWIGVNLSSNNRKQFWIPEGFAHGFMSLENDTEVVYKTTRYYSPEHECAIRWDDPNININWPNGIHNVSKKDKSASFFNNAHKL